MYSSDDNSQTFMQFFFYYYFSLILPISTNFIEIFVVNDTRQRL